MKVIFNDQVFFNLSDKIRGKITKDNFFSSSKTPKLLSCEKNSPTK